MTAQAYWIGNSTVSDMDGIWKYREANREVMNRYGAKFIAMHGQQEIVEGTARPTWTVVEFADGDMSIVEGYDGPQDI